MEELDVKNLKINWFKLKILGIGNLGICFLTPEGKVLKLFFNKGRIKELERYHQDLFAHFAEINSIGNETYMVPETLLIKNNKIVGYIANYGKGHQIAHLSPDTSISKIIKAYKPLIRDTKLISEQFFKLGDIHNGNILYDEINNHFYCIDLDQGKKDSLSSSSIMKLNMRALNDCIILALFGIDSYKRTVEFYDYRLQKIYEEATRREYEAIYDFLLYLQKEIGNPDVTCRTLKREKRKILASYIALDYYGRYL